MQTDGFSKSMYHQFSTSEHAVDLSLTVCKLLLKIYFPVEEMYGDMFHSITMETGITITIKALQMR